MSTHARPLAVWLAAASDAQLAALFAARGVRADVAWTDFFDAAEALLDPASIERVLPRLTLAEATALRRAVDGGDAGTETDALVALALLRPDGTPAPPVAETVGDRTVPAPPTADAQPAATEQQAARAAERAFTSVAAIADIVLLAADSPLTLLANGALGAGERRRISETGTAPEIIDDLAAIATDAGLLQATDRRLRVTDVGTAWLRLSASARWTALAEAFRDALPRGIRTDAGGWLPTPRWPRQHPWDPNWAQRSAALTARAELLGLITHNGAEPEWAVPLRQGAPADATALTRMLPAEVDRIFLQNDLTAIAPGTLEPALDVRLRSIADRESAAQASSYRFTADSIAHALTTGETASSILDFLGEISLTGIPQPLEYLVMQTSQRHGLVRVFTDPGSGRTRVTSTDGTLLDAMGVDQSLRPLALARDADGLTSRVGRDSVFWTLTDARYPAMIVGPDGAPLVVDRNPAPPPAPETATDHRALIARLRAQQGPDADAAWLDRELEAAVRARAVLLVEIAMPDGSIRELQLEASGMGGGRLRGRDRSADVERTLPVKSIRSARVIDPSTA
ncbi:helicase-associated domain-containing protein [Microbacterium paludicola]|uniref:helicase-associated domain-containing protein n=1 Tax=Microbacterium paludicola TaxID=300019 RepID=UPI0011AA4D47|nr:helicase-associated domain-containing protein [Microbacterium paludicola]